MLTVTANQWPAQPSGDFAFPLPRAEAFHPPTHNRSASIPHWPPHAGPSNHGGGLSSGESTPRIPNTPVTGSDSTPNNLDTEDKRQRNTLACKYDSTSSSPAKKAGLAHCYLLVPKFQNSHFPPPILSSSVWF
jgi:hypothetical protein